MQRRRLLTGLGALGTAGIAGCLGDSDDESASGNGNGTADDGNSNGENESVDIDTSGDYHTETDGEDSDEPNENGYETYAIEGEEVPLAPTDEAYEWYQNDDVVVADARSKDAYDRVHVTGAAWSPAPEGQDGEDPVDSLPEDTRILTYCACPHHLSGLRAADLIADEYTAVYALDEGIQDWVDKGYPVEGTEVG